VFVIDRQRVFVGSMNFDQRSLNINTEIGLIIDSPQIAREIATRFDAIVCRPTVIGWCWSRVTAGALWCDGQARKTEIGALHHRARGRRRQAHVVEALSLMPIGRLL
jgi:phosphatidylserine/phosphatidylglycerophosphate/cardiolipin synthase-like enzyme